MGKELFMGGSRSDRRSERRHPFRGRGSLLAAVETQTIMTIAVPHADRDANKDHRSNRDGEREKLGRGGH